jgi:uncharacterized membrane protein
MSVTATAIRSQQLPVSATAPAHRLASLDVIRGAVMVLMAIDHVRVYSGVPAGGPTAGVFLTRWVTHFCAPAFVFLAGTAAYLHGSKVGRAALAKYLATRGVLLVVLELTLIHVMWTFTFDFTQLLAGVIWMLGWCMILMAALIQLPIWAITTFGLITIFGQNILYFLANATPSQLRWIWQFVYLGGQVKIGESLTITVLYSIVPWIGVMAVGYAFGAIVVREAPERRRLSLRIGVPATALFLVVGIVVVYLQGAQDDAPPALFRLLNQQKYPASQLFLLMTLGPTIALVPLAERATRSLGRVLQTFGRVPMFYYLLHIPLIHATALVVWLIRDGAVNSARFTTAPYVSIPAAQRWSLPLLYLVFVVDVAILYLLCRWYAEIKTRRPQAWMRYVWGRFANRPYGPFNEQRRNVPMRGHPFRVRRPQVARPVAILPVRVHETYGETTAPRSRRRSLRTGRSPTRDAVSATDPTLALPVTAIRDIRSVAFNSQVGRLATRNNGEICDPRFAHQSPSNDSAVWMGLFEEWGLLRNALRRTT